MRVAVALLACGLAVVGCGSGASKGSRGSTQPSGSQALCTKALHAHELTASGTTLGAARATNFGGPYSGITPASGAFPELAASTDAAWCWTPSPTQSPGGGGRDWTLYVAVPDGRAARVFGMGGVSVPPTGPPSIP